MRERAYLREHIVHSKDLDMYLPDTQYNALKNSSFSHSLICTLRSFTWCSRTVDKFGGLSIQGFNSSKQKDMGRKAKHKLSFPTCEITSLSHKYKLIEIIPVTKK